jgi:aminomethyltransferase
MARRTSLYDRHIAAGAQIVDFGGYDMPLQYTGMRDEHLAVRERAGVFDVSHMGEVHFTGSSACETVNTLVANDVSRLAPGRALYGVMCNEDGGIVDDVIVYRDDEDAFMVVVNAACHDRDVAWMRDHLRDGTVLTDRTEDTALLAVQGPSAAGVVASLADADIASLRPFRFLHAPVAGVHARVSRTGYTGEDGFELYVDAGAAPRLWDALLDAGSDAGLRPAGLGARDTLRLEAGLRLYGQDMDDTVDPLSAALGWTVKLAGHDFIGSNALRRIDERGVSKRLVGLTLGGRAIARHGQPVLVHGRTVGEVTSGTFGFSVGHAIATAYVEPSLAADGTVLQVDIRGTPADATVTALPFYRRTPS